MILHCFNVGQGNCILAELPPDAKHPTIRFGLIDCFYSPTESSEPSVLTYLKTRGVSNLEFIVLTHPDEDHARGLSKVLEYYSTGGRTFKSYVESFCDCEAVCRANEVRKSAIGESVVSAHGKELQLIAKHTCLKVAKNKSSFKYESLGHAFTAFTLTDDLEMQFVAPTQNAFYRLKQKLLGLAQALQTNKVPSRLDLNDGSLAFMLKYGNARVLICGDVTSQVWTELVPLAREAGISLRSDFVAVSHHGADTGNPAALWDEIAHDVMGTGTPTFAVISCGYKNRHKHPSTKVLNRILSRQVLLFCINRGFPCRNLTPKSKTTKDIVAELISNMNKPVLDKVLGEIGYPIEEVCSGKCEFEILQNGKVKLLYRDRDADCLYASSKGFNIVQV